MFTLFQRSLRSITVGISILALVLLAATPALADFDLVIKSAYYGANCRASDYRPDPQYPQNSRNVTFLLIAAVEAAERKWSSAQVLSFSGDYMLYRIDHRVLGDPALGCPKEFKVTYWCSRDRRDRTVRVAKEASGQNVALDCRVSPLPSSLPAPPYY